MKTIDHVGLLTSRWKRDIFQNDSLSSDYRNQIPWRLTLWVDSAPLRPFPYLRPTIPRLHLQFPGISNPRVDNPNARVIGLYFSLKGFYCVFLFSRHSSLMHIQHVLYMCRHAQSTCTLAQSALCVKAKTRESGIALCGLGMYCSTVQWPLTTGNIALQLYSM